MNGRVEVVRFVEGDHGGIHVAIGKLTVIETCRQQSRNVFAYVAAARHLTQSTNCAEFRSFSGTRT
jgi:hypothetical protein